MSDPWSTYRLPLLMREPSGQSIAHLGGKVSERFSFRVQDTADPLFWHGVQGICSLELQRILRRLRGS